MYPYQGHYAPGMEILEGCSTPDLGAQVSLTRRKCSDTHAIGSASQAMLRVTWRLGVLFVVLVGLGLALASGADAFVYWDNYSSGTPTIVGRANLDGSGVNPSFIPGADNPCGVAVDAHYIYWAVGTGTTIARANLDGSNVNPNFITGATNPCGVAVDGQHIYWANGGGAGPGGSTIGRANLDGASASQSFITGADIPDAVAVDGTYIYWANRGPQYAGNATIGRAKLDGTSINESFITGASSPCGIAVDGAHVYWTNQPVVNSMGYIKFETNTIGRANLDGGSPNQSFITGLPGTPMPPTLCGLAVDSAHLYWTLDEGFGAFVPSIGRANLDGSGVNEGFINDGSNGARGVAVDALVPSTTALMPLPGSIIFGQTMSFTATVGGTNPLGGLPTPTGMVSFTVTGEPNVQVPLNGSGQTNFAPGYDLNVGDMVTASYGGDSAYGASSVSLTPTIHPAETVTSLSASPNPQTSSGEVTFTATVTNSSTEIVPFGSVQFLIDNEPVLGPQPLENNGQVAITGSGLPPGEYTVTALYHDDTRATPDFTDSQASLTEHITNPPPPVAPPPAKSAASSPPPPPRFQATLSVFPLGPTVRGLLKDGFSDGVVLTGPGSVSENLFSDNGVLPATASRAATARHDKSKHHKAASLLAKGSASVATAGTVNVTLLPTAAGKKILKKTRHSLRVVLITSVKDAKTGYVTNLPPHRLTLKH
jgi:virginiamycin B lyase